MDLEPPDPACCRIVTQLTADACETVESVVIRLKPGHNHHQKVK